MVDTDHLTLYLISHWSRAPKCPHAVSTWTYFSQNTGAIEDDDSLKVTCGAGQYHNSDIYHDADITLQNAPGPSPPPRLAPPWTTMGAPPLGPSSPTPAPGGTRCTPWLVAFSKACVYLVSLSLLFGSVRSSTQEVTMSVCPSL